MDQEFDTVDKIASKQNLINCYQIQIDDNDNCIPVHLGLYPELPLPVNKIIKYNDYNLHVVTYILSDDEIKQKLFKIVGIMIFKNNNNSSICSLDLIANHEHKYQLIFNDHNNNTTEIIETLDKFPNKDKVLEYIVNKSFEDPIKSIILKK